jgi:NADPH:quinone reductase-like Zn-dependent oxidoreductase
VECIGHASIKRHRSSSRWAWIYIQARVTCTNQLHLLAGTGGVSMFSLLICAGAGIRPIITSSSDRKLDLAKGIVGSEAVDTINYRDHPQWEEEARRLTNGRGVDVVVDNVGPASIAQSLSSLARRGTVSLVGFLGGFDTSNAPDTVIPTLMKSATIRYVAFFTFGYRGTKRIALLGESMLVLRLTIRAFATFCPRRRLVCDPSLIAYRFRSRIRRRRLITSGTRSISAKL